MIIQIECSSCEGGRRKWYYPNTSREIVCAYCRGTGRRDKRIPDPSHQMTEWRSEIRSPAGTARWYSVRHCQTCGQEELESVAGHFGLDNLEQPCAQKWVVDWVESKEAAEYGNI